MAVGDQAEGLVARGRSSASGGSTGWSTTPAGPRSAPFLEITPDEWDAVIAHRPDRGVPHLPRGDPVDARAGRGLDRQHRSRLGQMGIAETAAYSAAKAGLIGLTRSLAREFGPTRRPRQRRRAGLHADRDDRRPRRQEDGQAAPARHAARPLRPGRRGRRRGHVPALRRVGAVHRARRSTRTAGGTCHDQGHLSVREAVGLVKDGADASSSAGPGAGHAVAAAVHRRARRRSSRQRAGRATSPRCASSASATSPTAGSASSACPGLHRRTIGSNIGNEPRLGALVEDNELEAYSFPQGVLSAS